MSKGQSNTTPETAGGGGGGGHTEGPWMYDRSADNTWVILGTLEEYPHKLHAVPRLHMPRRRMIAKVYGIDVQGEANAQLISVATDLLEAAKEAEKKLAELAEDHPPNDWKPWDSWDGWTGYGDSVGDLGYVPTPDASNYDDVHSHGVAEGTWKSATVARQALASIRAAIAKARPGAVGEEVRDG